MELGTEERKVAIEIIATLVFLKNGMVELLLEPAGIPSEVYRPILNKRDRVTGRELSKRKLAPYIIDAMEKRPDGSKAVLEIIKIAANWTEDRFYLVNSISIHRLILCTCIP